MGVVIGFATQASLNGRCAANVSWGANPNTQRLYCLNSSFNPFMQIDRPTVNVNMTIYAPGSHISVAPSQSCTTQDQVAEATTIVNPASCDVSLPNVNYRMLINSYSYSKEDAKMPGQESYSMIRYVSDEPTYVIRGIAQGSGTDNAGITFTGTTSVATQGSVAAGGVGKAYSIRMGTVSAIGGGDGTSGETGRGDASIPHTPLWV